MVKYGRLEQIQFLRFCAFVLVFLSHTGSYQLSWFPQANGARAAVSFFFLLSGMVTGYSSFITEIKCDIKSIFKYMMKKIKKVYPLYIVTTMIAFIYSGFPYQFAIGNMDFIRTTIVQIIRNIFIIQSWFPSNYFEFNGVAWFLSSLMFLYLISLPIRAGLLKICKYKNNVIYLIIGLLITFLLMYVYGYMVKDINPGYTEYICPISRVGEYVCGIIIGFIVYKTKVFMNSIKYSIIIFTALEVISSIGFILNLYTDDNSWRVYIVNWIPWNVFLLFIFAYGNGIIARFFQKKKLVYLGDISFECFLIHQVVIYIYRFSSGLDSISLRGDLFSIAYCFVITIILSGCVHKFFELERLSCHS